MAIYHLSAKVISRASGRSAVAAAAYRSGEALLDERLGRIHDFSHKDDVIHCEVMLPHGAPEHLADRQTLWNEVEAVERRRDAQLAREIEIALPRELAPHEAVTLAREFVAEHFVARGMIADVNVHRPIGENGEAKPHVHVMLTLREVGPAGFGLKARDWNSTAQLERWREAWADKANERLAALGHDARIDHRSLEAQGIDLEPQHKIGPAGQRRDERGEAADRAAEHRALARRNGERIAEDPTIALRSITHQQSTFTRADLARFIHRHSDGAEQFTSLMSTVETSLELVRIGTDAKGSRRYTTREMIDVEARLERLAERLAGEQRHGVDGRHAAAALRDRPLGPEQRAAFEHVTGSSGLALVVGYAGTGKSTMLGAARAAWEAQGYTVRGSALSGIAAESLEGGSGIASRTIASLEHAWGQERDELTSRDVLVIDEAGLVGSRQLERVMAHARTAGAKVVLVGDPEQLQAIEAGAAFRALAERHGTAEISEVRRQRHGWQREATTEFATARTGKALARYAEAGMVLAHDTREAARVALVERWDAARRGGGAGASSVILAYTRDDVRALNEIARDRMRATGGLGQDVEVATERGERAFAVGDRIMFLRNERSLGVKNGTLGRVELVAEQGMTVALDGGGRIAFELKDYAHVDHGYAATIHKAQGVTVDRVFVLASDYLDRHATYVALTRHREAAELHYGRDDFADHMQLARQLGRERAKDTTLDYAEAFAELRGLAADPRARASSGADGGRFAGLRLSSTASQEMGESKGRFAGMRLRAGRDEPEPLRALREPDVSTPSKRQEKGLDIDVDRSRGFDLER